MELRDMDLVDRVPQDQAETITVDLGRSRVHAPQPLDWTPKYLPPRVVSDPEGREWTVIEWSDTGTSCDLATPMPD
jgi:hypothetical protein